MVAKFDQIDTIVVCAVLLISTLIGLFHGFRLKLKKLMINICNKKVKDEKINGKQVDEYFTANSSMGPFPIALSLLASFFSATALIGYPAEVYVYGIQAWTVAFGTSIVPLIGAFITGPFLVNLKVSSVFEYFEIRFDSRNVRLLGMGSYVVKAFIGASIFIYGPATSLNTLTNVDERIAIVLIGIIGTFYTTIGGIKGVIWTDVFQILIMFTSLLAIIITGIVNIGGISNLWEISLNGGRLNFFDFNIDPFVRQSTWSLFFGIMINFFMAYCIDQQMVQRFYAAKSKRDAQASLLMNIPLSFLINTLCCFTGLVLYANFFYCDPLSDKTLNVGSANQLVSHFVIKKLKMIPGISGLFLGSLLCGSLSSLSSVLNSQVSIIWNDYLKSLNYFKKFDDKKSVKVTKILAVICGSIDIGFAFIISQFSGNILQIGASLNGSFLAPIIGLFILGSMFKITNTKGAIFGTIAGFAAGVWLSMGIYFKKPSFQKLPVSTEFCGHSNLSSSYIYENYYKEKILNENQINGSFFGSSSRAKNLDGFDTIYSLSYMWFSCFGLMITIVVGLIVSLITRNKNKVSDELVIFDLSFMELWDKSNKEKCVNNNQDEIKLKLNDELNSELIYV